MENGPFASIVQVNALCVLEYIANHVYMCAKYANICIAKTARKSAKSARRVYAYVMIRDVQTGFSVARAMLWPAQHARKPV